MMASMGSGGDACRAWQLLVKFFFAQRGHLPSVGGEADLSPLQCHVLHLIEPDQPMPMGRLAETMGCDASNVTGLIDRLEARGFVQRQASAEDRRVKVIQLTATGSRMRARLLRHVTEASCRLSRLPLKDQRSLVRILEELLGEPPPTRSRRGGR
jgi:DNA-binding MarR family transcriptional regulator